MITYYVIIIIKITNSSNKSYIKFYYIFFAQLFHDIHSSVKEIRIARSICSSFLRGKLNGGWEKNVNSFLSVARTPPSSQFRNNNFANSRRKPLLNNEIFCRPGRFNLWHQRIEWIKIYTRKKNFNIINLIHFLKIFLKFILKKICLFI